MFYTSKISMPNGNTVGCHCRSREYKGSQVTQNIYFMGFLENMVILIINTVYLELAWDSIC